MDEYLHFLIQITQQLIRKLIKLDIKFALLLHQLSFTEHSQMLPKNIHKVLCTWTGINIYKVSTVISTTREVEP